MGDVPRRIQLRRTKGWRLPKTAISVARPTRWGNPWTWRQNTPGGAWEVWNRARERRECLTRTEDGARYQCIAYYREALKPPHRTHSGALDFDPRDVAQLRGRDLACWCRLCPLHAEGKPFRIQCPACDPCHADPLGMTANAPLRCEATNA